MMHCRICLTSRPRIVDLQAAIFSWLERWKTFIVTDISSYLQSCLSVFEVPNHVRHPPTHIGTHRKLFRKILI